jgi:hypothetical protein
MRLPRNPSSSVSDRADLNQSHTTPNALVSCPRIAFPNVRGDFSRNTVGTVSSLRAGWGRRASDLHDDRKDQVGGVKGHGPGRALRGGRAVVGTSALASIGPPT